MIIQVAVTQNKFKKNKKMNTSCLEGLLNWNKID